MESVTEKKKGKKRGPKEERLKIEGNWLEALKKMLRLGDKKPPKEEAKK